MTQKQLTALGVEWQKRLRLQDWEVAYEFCREAEIKADGETQYNKSLKCARIRIASEASRLGTCGDLQPYDAEQCLVHELLHLQWAHLPGDMASCDPTEAAIDLTAWALVRAKRGEI